MLLIIPVALKDNLILLFFLLKNGRPRIRIKVDGQKSNWSIGVPSKWALEIGLYKIYTFAQSVLCSGIKYLDSLSVGDLTIWHIANHTNP